MCYEATRDIPLKEVEVETPLAIAKTKVIAGKKLAFVPILRAGLGMVDGVLALLPSARVGYRTFGSETHHLCQSIVNFR